MTLGLSAWYFIHQFMCLRLDICPKAQRLCSLTATMTLFCIRIVKADLMSSYHTKQYEVHELIALSTSLIASLIWIAMLRKFTHIRQ